MIGYITVGSSDLATSAAFFDPLFSALGGSRAYTLDRQIAWGFGERRAMVIATLPFDDAPARPGNGTMVALMAADTETVDRLHALALSLGGTCEGPPGPRGQSFYGGYFRDPDGNKFNLFHMG